jgi:hypothetical protein
MCGENASMRLQIQNRQLDVKISFEILSRWNTIGQSDSIYVVHTDLI